MSMAWAASSSAGDKESAARMLPSWRAFLRGLALELEGQAGSEACTAVLRGTGERMARMLALPAVGSMEALELEMNAVLAEIGWGRVRIVLNEAERCVVLTHSGLPAIGSAGEPPGTWLSPVVEGLYETWLGQQPGADDSLRAQSHADGDAIVIRYGRGW